MASRQSALPSRNPAAILGGVFIALFLQLQMLLFLSLIDYRPVTFVQRIVPQLDLSDFIVATHDWLHGINPYLRQRFDKPPPSLLVAVPLQRLDPSHAALVFFLANVVILGAALRAICRHYRLSRVESLQLCGIASMYFPVLFLVERGNLDGFMLGLILLAIFAKNPVVRALGLSLSVGIKMYGALLFGPLLTARRWKMALLAAWLLILLLAPFHSLLLPFAHRQMARNVEIHPTENISPALFVEVFAKGRFSSLDYYGLWLISYVTMLARRRNASLEVRMVSSMPWMMALPVHVYAYTGVLLLPVLAYRSQEMARAGALDFRDYLFLCGFLLAGFQQTAWLALFHDSTFATVICSLANPAGTVLVLISFTIGGTWRDAAGPEAALSLAQG